MTKNDNESKKAKPVQRAELEELAKQLEGIRDFTESSVFRIEETLAAVRTQVQQLMSFLPQANVSKVERQKFR